MIYLEYNLNDELRAKLGAAARNSYECNFKLNIMIQMITQLYNNLI